MKSYSSKTIAGLAVLTLLSGLSTAMARPGGGGGPDGEQPGKHRGPPPHILEKFDADGDGQLNEQERTAAREAGKAKREELKTKYDTDGDGKLSPEERKALRQGEDLPPRAGKRKGHPSREDILKRFDADGDGQLNDGEKAKAKEARKRHQQQDGGKGQCKGKKGGKGDGQGDGPGKGGKGQRGGGQGGR